MATSFVIGLIVFTIFVIWWIDKVFLRTSTRDIRKAEDTDLDDIYRIIQKVRSPKDVFLKATKESLKRRLEYSYVCTEDDKIIGCCIIDYKKYDTPKEVWVIDTIVSTKRGVGSEMLSILPDEEYYTSISEKNTRSIEMFKKFGFVQIGYSMLWGYERIRFKKDGANK